ncbi:hypothetical protein [Paracoccus luteus]|uniref:hypothetical protein n=1 Tax=Paracoccus luteus TaxID=2508543 RepID=UPI0010700F67|nr:hypothetical protein [Paracoccus luteus]
MLSTVLIVLTLGHADGPHLAVTPADDAAACAAKAGAVTAVLEQSGYPVAAARCVETDQRFTPYRHGAGAPAPVNAFRVTLPAAGGAKAEPLAALSDCTAAPDADPAVFCALSAQELLAD